jgi:class 3 adenylate cyclase
VESHGLSGAVQITEPTWRLVKDHFHCDERATIDVKGAGPTRVWHVVREPNVPRGPIRPGSAS